MRTRSEALAEAGKKKAPAEEREKRKKIDVVIKHDAVNEQILLAAGAHDPKARTKIVLRCQPDNFLVPANKVFAKGLQEMEHRKLLFDIPTLKSLVDVDEDYVRTILESNPVVPRNLDHHIEILLWDRARFNVSTGPLASLATEIADPRVEPERVRSLARQVTVALDGFKDRTYLRDGPELVRSQMAEIEKRSNGVLYEFGVPALDYFEEIAGEKPQRRMIPGPAPGHTIVVTGLSGSGKTTTTAHLILGMRRQKRRVLVGAWEPSSGQYLELLATISLGFSRADVMLGNLSKEDKAELQAEMEEIASEVKFLDKAFFRKTGEKPSNERNLDIVQGYIADSGCDVFVADLWKRCLVRTSPEDEELALTRQQAMAEEMGITAILLQQQLLKDVEKRPDKRPTREAIKGSGAWTEIADAIIGVHRPALWKKIEDNYLEWFVLKQRYGKWPLGIEVPWNPEFGSIGDKGKSIPYDQPGESESSDIDTAFAQPKGATGRKWRPRR